MSLILQIPPGSNFFQPLAEFSATFNAVTPGFYDFNSAVVNLQRIRKNNLYIFERYSFSATIPEGSFLEAAAAGVTPLLDVNVPRQTNRKIYPDSIPLINYVDGLETLWFVYASQEQTLTASLSGRLTQPASIVGVLTLRAQVQFNIYEITNGKWIENFLGRTVDGQGKNLIGGR